MMLHTMTHPRSEQLTHQGMANGLGAEMPRLLARWATQALRDEATLTPKPALADLRGSGAHHDLSADLLLRSASALQPCFHAMAEFARHRTASLNLREGLGDLGRRAECTMLLATGGVNTHRGAIWALGLLVAAAAQGSRLDPEDICRRAATLASLPDRWAGTAPTHGAQARRHFNAGGAREEAQCGFPHVLHVGLPALRRARLAGIDETHARIDALLHIMAALEDTCLLHRGGRNALQAARHGALHTLMLGGSSTPQGAVALEALHHTLIGLWASPGGAADMLAATLFLDRMQEVPA